MRKHRFDEHKEELITWLSEGKTYGQIETLLLDLYGIVTNEPELCVYAKRRNLKNIIEMGRHSNEIPKCSGCEYYMEVGIKYVQNTGRKKNIRVCKACLEAIPQNVEYSPTWCNKRKGVI